MLRPSKLHPHLSAYTHVHGVYDFNKTPMAPPGQNTRVYETPQQQRTWDHHGKMGWYLGPAMDDYCCFYVYIPQIRGERHASTVSFFLHDVALPSNIHYPKHNIGDAQHLAIQKLRAIIVHLHNHTETKHIT